jgi:hypothetical protein
VGDQDHVDAAQRLLGRFHHPFVGREVVDVHGVDMDAFGAAHAQVVGDGLQAVRVAADQHQAGGAPGITACHVFRNGGGGTDDQDALHLHSMSRRHRPEEKAGSMWRENSARRG